jgi:hypothetical protein
LNDGTYIAHPRETCGNPTDSPNKLKTHKQKEKKKHYESRKRAGKKACQ